MKTDTLNDVRSILLVLAGFLLFPALNCLWASNYEPAARWGALFLFAGVAVKWIDYMLKNRHKHGVAYVGE